MFLMMLLLFVPVVCYSAEKTAWDDKLIAGSFKAMAKAFVATTDVKKLKEANIEKFSKMNEERFRKRYAEAYPVIKELPPKLKERYGIAETMSKEQAVKNIRSLDKKKMYELIDAVPDKAIAKEFKDYLKEQKTAAQESDVMTQIRNLWNKTAARISPPEKTKK